MFTCWGMGEELLLETKVVKSVRDKLVNGDNEIDDILNDLTLNHPPNSNPSKPPKKQNYINNHKSHVHCWAFLYIIEKFNQLVVKHTLDCDECKKKKDNNNNNNDKSKNSKNDANNPNKINTTIRPYRFYENQRCLQCKQNIAPFYRLVCNYV